MRFFSIACPVLIAANLTTCPRDDSDAVVGVDDLSDAYEAQSQEGGTSPHRLRHVEEPGVGQNVEMERHQIIPDGVKLTAVRIDVGCCAGADSNIPAGATGTEYWGI